MQVGQRELEVEPCGRLLEVEGRDRQARQRRGAVVDVLIRQHGLEQRVAGLGAARRQHVHEAFERQLGLIEGRQIGNTNSLEQFRERFARPHGGAQDQGVDEHAHHTVEDGVTAAGDRRADDDVLAAGQLAQQDGQRGVQHHEQRGTVAARGISQRRGGRGRERAAHGGAAMRGDRRSRPVGGQREFVGDAVEDATPVLDLAGREGFRIVLGAEPFPLPHREIRVLDGQRRPVRCRTGRSGGVRRRQVAGERSQGEAVGGDVVHHQDEDVLGRIRCGAGAAEQRDAYRNLLRHIESGCREFGDRGGEPGLGDRPHPQIRRDLPGGHDHLVGAVAVLGVSGPQRLVPLEYVAHRGFQCGGVEFTGEAQRQWQVVDR
ncbi:hypothetical protein NRB56_76150 [Nocardia sp. RB56]|uniref:Uncharacterized protein n=1 Tax=Nocardia aurantia TaxID=2585199 RepID=A0A7K0E292_9NOCA|nr:hypothetical protein [Nocardia aurantia]